ncbi:hypothetical protein [Mycobacterium sp.]|uniref:hypothetical protein n=1 Tax=Mycobacterium sp. TaxID=1785 RepID=UPI003F954BE0
MISPYRLYSFWLASDSTGFNVSWEDHWYNQFEMKDMVVSSNNYPMTKAFPLPTYTYTARSATDGSSVANQTRNPYIPAPGLSTAVSVGAVAPALLGITADFTYFESVEMQNGHYVGIDDSEQAELSIAVDVSRGQEILWDYALTFDAAPPTMVPVGSNPVTLPFPGDYRRPGNAPLTGMLTDDELWAVAHLAGSIGVSGPALLGILLELTGARRNAYHPAGHYGISNLTPAQVAAGGIADVTEAAGGIADVTDFVNASVHRQLAVTAQYLSTLTPAVSGVLPVFFTLATGTPQPSVTATTSLPVGGVPMTGGQATQRINNRVLHVTDEFKARLPQLVTPIIGVTG